MKYSVKVTMSTRQQVLRRLSAMGLALTLGACQVPSQYSTVNRDAYDDIQQSLVEAVEPAAVASAMPSADVLQALVPGLTLNRAALETVEERFDFAVQDAMDIREFFTLLTEGTDYSIVVHPDVNGSVSALDLKNVTIGDVMEQVSLMYGYVINRNGSIFQVTPGGLQTRIYKVDYLNVNRNGTSNMQVVAGGILSNGGQGQTGFGGGIPMSSNPYLGAIGGSTGNNLSGQNGNSNSGSGSTGSSAGGASINTRTEANYWEDLQDIISSIINAGPVSQDNQDSGGGLLGALTRSSSSRTTQPRAVTEQCEAVQAVYCFPGRYRV